MDISKEPKHDPGDVRRRAGQVVVRQHLPAGPPAGRAAASASCRSSTRPGTSTAASVSDLKKNCGDTDQAVRRPGQGPEAARPARRHAGDLGRRVRPDADGAGRLRRPRPSPELLHHVAGRRRRQARPDARRERRVRLQRHRGQGPRPRPARDDPAPARLRSHAS